MPRRPSLITAITKAINQAEVAKRRQQHQAQVNYAINSSSGPKEMPPTYYVSHFDFNEETRACKVEIVQTTQYRTIERYVTQNYVKHPIYSNWKSKTKTIKKSLRLTNENLEKLQSNDDPLIRKFAADIVDSIRNDELYPSWYLRDMIVFDCAEKADELRLKKEKIVNDVQERLKKLDSEMSYCKTNLYSIKNSLNKNKKNELKSKKIIDKIDKSSKLFIFKILTFGIYGAMVSKKRYDKHSFLYYYYKKLNEDNVNDIANLEAMIETYDSEKKQIESIKYRAGLYFSGKTDVLKANQDEMLELIVPLTY